MHEDVIINFSVNVIKVRNFFWYFTVNSYSGLFFPTWHQVCKIWIQWQIVISIFPSNGHLLFPPSAMQDLYTLSLHNTGN